jgi:hypothetical protein
VRADVLSGWSFFPTRCRERACQDVGSFGVDRLLQDIEAELDLILEGKLVNCRPRDYNTKSARSGLLCRALWQEGDSSVETGKAGRR